MKTSIKILTLTFMGGLLFTACKKDYTCDCSIDGVYYIHYDYTNMSEDGAKAACLADQTLLQQESGQNVQCTIK